MGYGRQAVGDDCSFFSSSITNHVTVAQLVEHGTHKPGVAGSIPARDTIRLRFATPGLVYTCNYQFNPQHGVVRRRSRPGP